MPTGIDGVWRPVTAWDSNSDQIAKYAAAMPHTDDAADAQEKEATLDDELQ
jgi:hypothetical protein